MSTLTTENFQELSGDEMLMVDGGMGVVCTAILIGTGCFAAGFGIGYGLSCWLG